MKELIIPYTEEKKSHNISSDRGYISRGVAFGIIVAPVPQDDESFEWPLFDGNIWIERSIDKQHNSSRYSDVKERVSNFMDHVKRVYWIKGNSDWSQTFFNDLYRIKHEFWDQRIATRWPCQMEYLSWRSRWVKVYSRTKKKQNVYPSYSTRWAGILNKGDDDTMGLSKSKLQGSFCKIYYEEGNVVRVVGRPQTWHDSKRTRPSSLSR